MHLNHRLVLRPGSRPSLAATLALLACTMATGQLQAQSSTHLQVVKPPKTQLWIDVSTGGMAGMPELDIPGLGGLMGGIMGAMGKPKPTAAYYGEARTQHMMPPRVLDVALWNSLKPGQEAALQIPAGLRMGESLPLLPIKPELAAATVPREPGEPPAQTEPPQGRLLMYWGCGETVRPGQPRVIDFSKLTSGNVQAFGNAFAGRFAVDRGARVKPGYAVFPNEREQKSIPKDASLVGDHSVAGDGIPASFQFALNAAQDVMPAIELQTMGSLQDSIGLSWINVTNARAYYLHAMSVQGRDIILWSSSENGDSGMGLFDYLPNATISQWTKEKVLLGAEVTQCRIPKGILGTPKGAAGASVAPDQADKGDRAAAFLRMMAYGGEHNIVYPPRPTDPKTPWDQEWSVRLRVKAHTMAMLGQEMPGLGERKAATDGEEKPAKEAKPTTILPVNPMNLLRGLFGK